MVFEGYLLTNCLLSKLHLCHSEPQTVSPIMTIRLTGTAVSQWEPVLETPKGKLVIRLEQGKQMSILVKRL